MIKWEYKSVQKRIASHADLDMIDALLNSYGKDGWEVVGLSSLPINSVALDEEFNEMIVLYLFKRNVAELQRRAAEKARRDEMEANSKEILKNAFGGIFDPEKTKKQT